MRYLLSFLCLLTVVCTTSHAVEYRPLVMGADGKPRQFPDGADYLRVVPIAGTDAAKPAAAAGNTGLIYFATDTNKIYRSTGAAWILFAFGGVGSSAIGAAPNASGLTITGGNTVNLEPASASFGGVVTTGTQTFAGDKTFSGTTIFTGHQAAGSAATINAGYLLNLVDTYSGALPVYRGIRVETTHQGIAGAASTGIDVLNYTSGVNNHDHTVGVQVRPQHGSSGTISDLYGVFSTVGALNGSGTVTNAYSLYSAIPSKSGTATITNAYGLYVEAVTGIGSTANWALFSNGANSLNSLYVPTLTSGRFPLISTGGQIIDSAQASYSSSGRIVNIGDGSLSSGSYLQLQAAAGQERQVVFNTGTSNRWGVGVQTNAELGADAGAPFAVSAYSDASALIDAPITIARAAGGAVTLSRSTASTSTTTGALVVAGGAGFGGKVSTVATTTGTAGLNVPHGTAPSSPVNGDIWTTTSGLFSRINGATSQVSGTNTGDQTITLTGDVTGSGTGSFAATIAADAVTNTKLANMATQTFKGRTTAATGDPEDLTVAQAKTMLNLTGTNSGDLTLSAIGSTANANGATLTGQALNLQPASAGFGGVVTTGAQTFAGDKTFSGAIIGASDPGGSETIRTTGNVRFGAVTINNSAAGSDAATLAYSSFQRSGTEKGYVGFVSGASSLMTLTNLIGQIQINPLSSVYIGADPGGSEILKVGGDVKSTGNLIVNVAGKGLQIKEGSNAKMGTATLAAGAVTVSTTAVTASSRIFLTSQSDGGTVGFQRVSARTAGTSFTITSSSGTDTSTIAWFIVEPSP